NVAMLVNGYSAIDTRRAARVLAEYSDYSLSGMDVVVTGTDFSDISVMAAEEMAAEEPEMMEEEVVEETME
ncbi:hypothetical protein KY321_04705, partial [Candidatus Woesearchaeota archaeon]|nr:hypothetical protein [Candidatus Woesearchaeota archaeon]